MLLWTVANVVNVTNRWACALKKVSVQACSDFCKRDSDFWFLDAGVNPMVTVEAVAYVTASRLAKQLAGAALAKQSSDIIS
jgi:hypothetical protein